MEFEFDEALLEGKADCATYKKRFREYMSGAKQNKVYGTQPLSYYHGTNALYDLSKSTAEPRTRSSTTNSAASYSTTRCANNDQQTRYTDEKPQDLRILYPLRGIGRKP